MRLEDQRDELRSALEDLRGYMQGRLEYLGSPKFRQGDDWVRTWEPEQWLLAMRCMVQNALERIGS
jgi:hypothetical protein